jgi:CRISPR-associated protein Csx1
VEKRCSQGTVGMEDRTTLPAVSRAEGLTDALVLVPDSIISAVGASRGCLPPSADPQYRPQSYLDLVREARRLAEDWAQHCATIGSLDLSVDFEVVPNPGHYRWLHATSPAGLTAFDLYGSYALHALISKMLDLGDVERLVVDLTHGINYMPTLVHSAALTAASVYTAATGREIEVVFYNSEPFTPGVASVRIWRVAEVKLSQVKAAKHLLSAMSLAGKRRPGAAKFSGRPPEALRDLRSSVDSLFKDILLPAVGAYIVSAPLAAAYIACMEKPSALSTLHRLISDMLCEARRHVVVHVDPQGGVRVEWLYGPSLKGVEEAYAAAGIAAAVERAGLAACSSDPWKGGLTLDELRSILNIMRGESPEVAASELDNINRKCCLGEGECELELRAGLNCIPQRIDKRNFIAHGGLERNSVEAPKDEDCIKIKYREGCWDHVKRLLSDIAAEKLGLT